MTGSIESLLNASIGLDAASVGPATIERAVKRRMQVCAVPDHGRYRQLLEASPEELAALIDEVVVPETWFFRDGEPFRALAENLLRTARERPAPLRVLSIPCATGEEAYSIAITAHEAGLDAAAVTVDAVDVSGRVVAAAARGVFGPYSFRGSDDALQRRHFSPCEGGWRIAAAMRERVRFHCGNLLEPESLPGVRYDVIFCRNLLIYFGREARCRAVTVLTSLLAPDGLLFVGHAETAMFQDAGLVALPRRNTFAFSKTAAAGIPGPAAVSGAAPWLRRPAPRAVTRREAAPPAVPAAGDGLAEARALADQGRFDEAIAACLRSLDRAGDCAEAYFLLAVLYESAGDDARAGEMLHKAVYLEPAHEQALLHLALLAEQAGDTDAAAGFRRRARRASEHAVPLPGA